MSLITCKICSKKFNPTENQSTSCSYHPLSFVCRPHPSDHYAFELNDQLMKDLKTWKCEFWDCCGEEDRSALGCKSGYHKGYDE
ncbi:hypothetical protein CONCODRAFT_77523 [Conidiobolus coronatus NRRL 28638]|uniref:Uncharacterized protein n=1 Tax=Conidiobolus coronatus (strain ATCC 28846 / CBS 209.66 / NRRL 28638) TaxID=796925 RepID=A0A137PDH0_CONC2|nr:hypothetical protein CONCODRAFT_77523 [Conidiobolus coronatus NRRL 28638]|eukprot:KXN72981.1 hypothetical protein CONCODRAFT_77523 [Conidiobolus coronatus NRRL 28638]